MKHLLIGIALVVLVGIGAFVYRSTLERPMAINPGNQQACTLEAKMCPDGSSVGRTGPNCEFAACAFPNVEDASLGISFVVPAGYKANPTAIGADPSLRAVFDSATLPVGGIPHSLIIRQYPIPAGMTANEVILANTFRETSGMQVESMSEFKPVITNGKTYQSITVERFEAIIHTEYYLVRDTDILRFEVIERDVYEWTNPDLKIESLSAHKALLALLSTLQSK